MYYTLRNLLCELMQKFLTISDTLHVTHLHFHFSTDKHLKAYFFFLLKIYFH